jgi:transposase
MLKDKNRQLSIYSVLYNRIPKNHILKLVDEAIDFTKIVKLIEKSYKKYYGRPAKDPELMLKLLILQYLYNLSDEKVIEESNLNVAYMYFLGINPEDTLPDPSLLAKFRKFHLMEITLDEIIVEIVKQCVEKGIIKDNGISIDATHTHANTFKAIPERIMKYLAKNLFKALEKEVIQIPDSVDQTIPDYTEIEDHKEAKKIMKEYLETQMQKVEEITDEEANPLTYEVINTAKEILADPKFMEQKGVRSLVDIDARVGHKSKTETFFGYKTEYIITTEERIITAARINDGAYVDGTQFSELMELTQKTGLEIKEVYGDKAYFKKSILDEIKEAKAHPYIPVSECAYKIDEELFSYNKDSDEWFCIRGKQTISKESKEKKDGRKFYQYHFNPEGCKNCPIKVICKKGSRKGRMLEVGLNTPEFYTYSQEQKTDEFKEKYKNRACQEWKNGELKNHHGLNRARGYGLRSMSVQAKLTIIAVNLKRIAKILSSFFIIKPNFLENLLLIS